MTTSTPSPAPSPTPEVKKTWMPTTAGILTIIAGAGNLFAGLIVSLAGSIASWASGFWGLGAIGVPLIILGIIAIVGGVFALQRKTWWLALVGAIVALMWPCSLLGILSVIFVCVSKKEFK